MKKCANCGHNNPKERNRCIECNMIFVGEIPLEELANKMGVDTESTEIRDDFDEEEGNDEEV